MSDRSSTWQLKFNEANCKHLNLGPPSENSYEIRTNNTLTSITITNKAEDLGVIIGKTLNFQNMYIHKIQRQT